MTYNYYAKYYRYNLISHKWISVDYDLADDVTNQWDIYEPGSTNTNEYFLDTDYDNYF
ncbi:MAG: hypothetical protein IPI23_21945 [Bacteroidetes bacterium]|nr:hypothetical protein [Bacteroidota bacterium]